MSSGVRPRYGRISALGLSVMVTGTALLGSAGVLPDGVQRSYAGERQASESAAETAQDSTTDSTDSTDSDAASAISLASGSHSTQAAEGTTSGQADDQSDEGTSLPPDSGEGRRVVFDMSDQRVWLVRRNGAVARTYPVSGSIYDNLDAGTYEVYSRSKEATGIEDSGTMKYMVRFAHGDNAAIGFHDIPVSDGMPVQSRDELGTPLSHGCVRQWRTDAKALWEFAPLGTTVVVTD